VSPKGRHAHATFCFASYSMLKIETNDALLEPADVAG
jgi:hypothetical protein